MYGGSGRAGSSAATEPVRHYSDGRLARGRRNREDRLCPGTGHDRQRRDVLRHDCTSPDDRSFANMHTFEDQSATPNPDLVLDHDRFRPGGPPRMPVKVSIHDHNVPSDFHTPADPHRLCGDDVHVPIQVGSFSEKEGRSPIHLEPDTAFEGAALDDDLAALVLYNRTRSAR